MQLRARVQYKVEGERGQPAGAPLLAFDQPAESVSRGEFRSRTHPGRRVPGRRGWRNCTEDLQFYCFGLARTGEKLHRGCVILLLWKYSHRGEIAQRMFNFPALDSPSHRGEKLYSGCSTLLLWKCSQRGEITQLMCNLLLCNFRDFGCPHAEDIDLLGSRSLQCSVGFLVHAGIDRLYRFRAVLRDLVFVCVEYENPTFA